MGRLPQENLTGTAADRSRWERIGLSFEEEVFDVPGNDINGVLLQALQACPVGRGVAADFGCGTGRLLPDLATRFKKVHAFDLAQALVEQAEERCSAFDNIVFEQRDLTKPLGRGVKVDVAASVNALLTVDAELRRKMLRTIRRSMAPGGHLILVVPSLESALLIERRLAEWHKRARGKGRYDTESLAADRSAKGDVLQGHLVTGGVLTKHFLREELEILLDQERFEPRAFHKVEHPWSSEFLNPPLWMGKPLPWDWLVVGRAL